MKKVELYSFLFSPTIGGAQTKINNMIDMNIAGIEFEVLTDAIKGCNREERIGPNAAVKRITPNNWMGQHKNPYGIPWRYLAYYAAIMDMYRFSKKRKYLMKADFDIFHVFSIEICNLLLWSKIIGTENCVKLLNRIVDFSYLKKPTVITDLSGFSVPEYFFSSDYTKEEWEFIRIEMEKFENVICVERKSYENLKRYSEEHNLEKNMWIIPNSVNTERFGFREIGHDNKLRIGYVARIGRPCEDQTLLYEFIKNLPDFIEFKAAISASEEDLRRHRGRFSYPNVQLQVNMPTSKMNEFYHSIDMLINPVLIEGIGNNTIEAMSCGRPVIKVKVGDTYPVIDRKTGFIIDRDYASLVNLLAYLNDNREELRKVGRMARKTIEQEYSHQEIAPKYAEVYKTIS